MVLAKLESEGVKSNDIKKGEAVILRKTGWRAEMLDNMKGNTRMAKVYGTFEECDS